MGKLKIDGDLLLTGSISFQTPNCITPAFSAKVDSSGYGQNLLIGAGGNTVIGGGEGAQEFFAAAGIKDEENIYLAATSIYMYTDCNDIANRKLVMSLNADGTISLPNSKKIDTDGTFSGNAAGIYRANHFTTEEGVDSFQAINTLQYCTIGAEYTPIGNDGILISAGWSSGKYGAQIWIDDGGSSGGMKIRSFGANDGTKWNEWQTVLTSLNYNDYTVTKTGSGASGTWGINVTGSAGSVAWGNVTGKPSTFTPSSHTHSYLPLSGGTMTGTIITPGNDSVVIKPANHNYDQIGASDCKFWKVFATTFYGNLSGNADTATTASAVAWGNVTGKPSTFTPSSHTHNTLTAGGEGGTASVRTADYTSTVLTGGWADANAGYGHTWGTTLDISGFSTWYHRLAFRTDGNIEYWQGINTKTMTKVGNLCFTGHSHSSYLPLSGGTMTGKLQVNNIIFGYNYTNSNNAAAFIWDKNGSNYTGVGSCNTTDVIHFGPCGENGAWVSNYNQIWRFQGGVYAMGWLETDNYGSSAPGSSTPGYGRGGAIYYQI